MLIQTFLYTLTPMLTLFLCLAIGFICKKLKLLPDNANTVMSKLETWVLCPALTISTFSTRFTVSNLKTYGATILYAVLLTIVAFTLGNILARIFVPKECYERGVYKYAMTIANCGFMGDPIVLGLFGADMLFVYKLFTLPLTLLIYSWGILVLIPKGEKKESMRQRLISPLFYIAGVSVGAILGITGLGNILPEFIGNTLTNLSSCMGPVAMLLSGFTIGGYSMKAMLAKKKVYIASVLRLIILPAIFISLLLLIDANDHTLICTFIAFATPFGLNTVVFPLAYGADPSTGASMTTISTMLCVVTIPIMFSLLGLFVDFTPLLI